MVNDGHKSTPWVNQMLPWILPAGFILVWLAASELGLVPPYVLPHPREIIDSGYVYILSGSDTGMYAGRFFADAKASLIRVIAGFTIAAAAGIPLGVMPVRLPVVERLLSTSVNGIRAVPGISWLPLALIWFGIGMKTTVFLVALAAFFPIYINSASGVRQVSPVLLRAGAMMGVRRLRGTFAILLPGAMPSLISGLRLGLGISWAYLVLGELTGVQNGLGAVIMDARMVGRTDVIIVGIVIIAVIGRVSDQVLTACLRLCFKSARRSA
ncbi:MAG: ABC transporter permease [Desulfobacterales bacterium]